MKIYKVTMNTWKNFTCFGENHASKIDDKWQISDENVLEFSEVYKKIQKKSFAYQHWN